MLVLFNTITEDILGHLKEVKHVKTTDVSYEVVQLLWQQEHVFVMACLVGGGAAMSHEPLCRVVSFESGLNRYSLDVQQQLTVLCQGTSCCGVFGVYCL